MSPTEKLPAPMDANNPFMDPELREEILRETNGDPQKLRNTNVIIFDESPRQLDDVLSVAGWTVNHIKLASKIASSRNDIHELLTVTRNRGTGFYIGGGILESITPKESAKRTAGLQKMEIDTVEISEGPTKMSQKNYRKLLKSMRAEFNTMLVEIGSKTNFSNQSYEHWKRSLGIALEEGADGIILEGCGSGDCGIYANNHDALSLLVAGMYDEAGNDADKIIIEAPYTGQAGYWLESGGRDWNVPIGNAKLDAGNLLTFANFRFTHMAEEVKQGKSEIRKRLSTLVSTGIATAKKRGIPVEYVFSHPQFTSISIGEKENFEAAMEDLQDVGKPRTIQILDLDTILNSPFTDWGDDE